MKLLLSAIFLIIYSSAAVTANTKSDREKILGQWQCSMSYTGNVIGELSITFNKDLRGYLNAQVFSYQLLPDSILRMNNSGDNNDYHYTFENNHLLLTYNDGSSFDCQQALSSKGGLLAPVTTNEQASISGSEWQLKGTFCNWSGSSSYSSSYSSTRRITFDGHGHWRFGTQSSFSGDAGMAYGGQDADDSGSYKVENNRISYISSSGERGIATINVQQNDGRITEIYLGKALYSPALCE